MARHSGFRNFFEALLKLTRFWNLIIISLGQYFAAGFLISSHTIFDPRLFLLSASTVLIAAAGYIINDYYDIKIDLINKPDRVVVGRGIPRRHAILYHVLLSGMGILIGVYLSVWIGLVNIMSVFLLWYYSNNLKRQPVIGNFVVALLTGLSILIVDLLYPGDYRLIFIYALFAFFMTLVREIIKDMEDLKGDDTFGCRTLPIIWGIRRTKVVIYGIMAAFSLMVIWLNRVYVGLSEFFFIPVLFVPLFLLLARLIRADTRKDFAWLSNFCKLIMLLGILSMAFV